MRGADLPASRGAIVAAAAFANEGAQHGEREPRVRDDGQRHGLEVAEILGPLALSQLREPDVDDRRPGRNARTLRAVGAVAVQLAQRPVQVADIERDHEIGVLERLAARQVERMPVRDVHAAVEVDDRGADLLREADELRDGVGMPPGEFGDDDRPLRARDELRDLRERRWIGLHRRRARSADHVVDRDRVIQWVLLQPRVVAEVHRPSRLRRGDAIRARERSGKVVDRRGLVVPLGEVAHGLALDLRRVDPVDGRPPPPPVERTGRAEQHQRHAVEVCVVHAHRRVQ